MRQHETYRNAKHQSIQPLPRCLMGRKQCHSGCRPAVNFRPGCKPMNRSRQEGAVAALASVAKLPFQHAHDGISYTFAVSPGSLGKDKDTRIANLVGLLDGYFTSDGGQHLNVNVFDKELLLDAMAHPENYPQLTIRVSGYAVNFIKLTKEQQLDVISRTINQSL